MEAARRFSQTRDKFVFDILRSYAFLLSKAVDRNALIYPGPLKEPYARDARACGLRHSFKTCEFSRSSCGLCGATSTLPIPPDVDFWTGPGFAPAARVQEGLLGQQAHRLAPLY